MMVVQKTLAAIRRIMLQFPSIFQYQPKRFLSSVLQHFDTLSNIGHIYAKAINKEATTTTPPTTKFNLAFEAEPGTLVVGAAITS